MKKNNKKQKEIIEDKLKSVTGGMITFDPLRKNMKTKGIKTQDKQKD